MAHATVPAQETFFESSTKTIGNIKAAETLKSLVPNERTIEDYIHRITAHLSSCDCKGGKLCISSFGQDPTTKKDITPKFEFFPPSDPIPIIDFIKSIYQEKNRNVYLTLALLREKKTTDGRKLGRSGKEEVISVFGIVADFDDKEASKYLDRLPLPPNLAFESSEGNYHAHYYFKDPITPNEADILAKALIDFSGCDPASLDYSKAWRIPGTLNCPTHNKCMTKGRSPEPQLSKIVQEFSGYTDPQELREKLKAQIQSQEKKKAAKPLSVTENNEETNDNLFIWDGLDIETLPLGRETKDLILNGKPAGQRSEAIMSVLCGLVRSNCTDEQILTVMEDYPIGEKYREQKEKRQAWLEKQIVKARGFITDRATQQKKPSQSSQVNKKPLSDLAKEMAKNINFILYKKLELAEDNIEARERIAVNPETIDMMLNSSFWSGNKNKIFIISQNGEFNLHPAPEAYKFLALACGNPIDKKALTEAVDAYFKGKEAEEAKVKPAEKKEFINECLNLPKNKILDYLKSHQRECIQWSVDMFANESRMEKNNEKVKIILTHKPFIGGEYNQKIIDDYKNHFTRFDNFVDFLVAAKFARDRKKAFLWIHSESDWGKSFLSSILSSLEISVEMSVKELEAIVEGKPCGKSPTDFKRSFALIFNEFKSVKSELKQLESSLRLSPKNQLESTVEVFAKIFLSAENVASLITENGVEDQFCNRMSLFKESGNLSTRPLFVEVGKAAYFDSVKNYFVERVNLAVAEMQSLGKANAEKDADEFLNKFIKNYGLDTFYKRLSETLPDIAKDFATYCKTYGLVIHGGDGFSYLRAPGRAFEKYLSENYPTNEISTWNHKKNDIEKLCSDDGKGYTNYRINGYQTKAIKLKKYN